MYRTVVTRFVDAQRAGLLHGGAGLETRFLEVTLPLPLTLTLPLPLPLPLILILTLTTNH